MDVEGEQFLPEIKTLATVFDALFVTVDLEQKQDVVFVYLAVAVVFLQKFLDFLFDLGFQLFLLYIYLSFWVKRLVFIQVALQESMVQVNVC